METKEMQLQQALDLLDVSSRQTQSAAKAIQKLTALARAVLAEEPGSFGFKIEVLALTKALDILEGVKRCSTCFIEGRSGLDDPLLPCVSCQQEEECLGCRLAPRDPEEPPGEHARRAALLNLDPREICSECAWLESEPDPGPRIDRLDS